MGSLQPGSGKFQQRPLGRSSWCGFAAAGGGWELLGPSWGHPHPGGTSPQAWGSCLVPGSQVGVILDPNTWMLGFSSLPSSPQGAGSCLWPGAQIQRG